MTRMKSIYLSASSRFNPDDPLQGREESSVLLPQKSTPLKHSSTGIGLDKLHEIRSNIRDDRSSRIGGEIMARKRLSDLLREEEQKGADNPAPVTPPKQTAPKQAPKTTGKATTPAAAKSKPAAETAEVIATQAEQVSSFVAELRDQSDAASVPPAAEALAIAELETTIAQLKAELEAMQKAAHHQETAYQTQIHDLKQQLAGRDAAMQQLQTSFEQMQQQAEQAKTDLEVARQMILQLSQVNGKPAATKSSLKTLPVLESPRAAEPELESKPLELIMPTAKSKTEERPKLHQLELRKVLDHPTQPGTIPEMPPETKPTEQPVKLTDTDVGWMD